jgi:epsilon-lactone hydrolase
MLSIRGRLFRWTLRQFFRRFVRDTSLGVLRNQMKMTGLPLPSQTKVESVQFEHFTAEWISTPASQPERVVLYLHGGGYTLRSPGVHRAMVARIAAASQARAFMVLYRLAPEHVFPAALDDAETAYHWLIEQGIAPHNIIVAGDSAGGGLAVALPVQLRAKKLPLPAACVLISPWLDLTMSIGSATEARFPALTREQLYPMGLMYAGEQDLRHPLMSPLYADLQGLPPMLIQTATLDILHDEAVRFAEKARASGVVIQLEDYADLWHAWQIYPPVMLPEAGHAIKKIGEFMQQQWGAKRAT